MNRVVEARDDQGRGGRQQQEDDEKDKKKKDKFDKGKPFWKKLIPASEGQTSQSVGARLVAGEKPSPLQLRQEALLGGLNRDEEVTDEEEQSVTLSRKILVLWGVVDMDGRPRV